MSDMRLSRREKSEPKRGSVGFATKQVRELIEPDATAFRF